MRRVHLLVISLYSLLAVALTWPLVLHLTTHVPGSDVWAYDEYTFLWNLWYFKHALVDQLSTPLYTDLIFYPVGMGLVMYTFNLMAAALALPLHLPAAEAIPLASNLINLGSTVLSGYGAFLLSLYLLRTRAADPQPAPRTAYRAAFIAGLVYAFASSRFIYLALGHYMIVTTQWIPFFLLYFLRTLHRRRLRDALLAGVFAALCLLTDMIFGVLLALMVGVLLLERLMAARRSLSLATLARGVARLAVVGAVAALLSAPLLLPTVREGLDATYAVEGWGLSDRLSADLIGLVIPTDLHPLWGSGDWPASLRAVQTGASRFSDVNTVFLGYATLALALVGAFSARRRARGWAWVALAALVLALGPLLQINGQSEFNLDGLRVNVPLPYLLVHYLPFIKGFRAPNRFSIVLVQALAVLAGYGSAWLMGQAARAGRAWAAAPVAALLAAAVLFEHLAAPMPLTDARIPAPYRALAAEPGDGALLQLPMGWRNGFGVLGAEDTRVEWYQSAHGRPILSGNTSRNPAFKFEYFARLPLVQAVTGIEGYAAPDAATDAAARASAAELMALWDVRYLAVNAPVAGRYPLVDTWQATRAYVLDVVPVDPAPRWDADGVQIYAVQQAPVPFPFELDLGSRATEAYRGPGWSTDEADIAGASGIWVDGQQAELYLPLRFAPDAAQDVQITLRLHPFSYPDAPAQRVALRLNGVALGEQPLAAGWQEVRVTAPAAATRSGLNRLTLDFSTAARPLDVLPGQLMIGNSGVQAPLDIEINSGGAAQDIAFITLITPDGESRDGSAGRRGYNLAALDAHSGEVLAVRGFDTAANSYEADRLAEFVEGLPDGVVVVAATRGAAGAFLNERAVAALHSLGSAVDLRSTPDAGHALVGVKGAPLGSALEQSAAEGAYLRLTGDRRRLAAAVDWVRLEAPAAP